MKEKESIKKQRRKEFNRIKGEIKHLRDDMLEYIENPMDRVTDEDNFEKCRQALTYVLKAYSKLVTKNKTSVKVF